MTLNLTSKGAAKCGFFYMIRKAEIKDFEIILDMCAEFWQHTQFEEPFRRYHTRKMIQMAYDHELLIVAENGGEVVGFLAAIKSPLLGSDLAWMATELAWWINPSNRGTMLGMKLIETFEKLCMEQGVKYVNMAFMETSMPEQIKSMYKKFGYTLQETMYTKVIK